MINLKKRIIIVEQDEKLKSLLAAMVELSGKYYLVQVYSNCEEASKHAIKEFPDIVILNLDYPGKLGIEFISFIQEKTNADVLIISSYTHPEIIFTVLSVGAKGYISTSNIVETLIKALDDLAKGGSPLDPLIARRIVEEMHVTKTSPISERETEVLRLMIQGNTYMQIAAALSISIETAKTHIKNIYRKLKVNSKSEAVRRALEDRLISKSSLTILDYQ